MEPADRLRPRIAVVGFVEWVHYASVRELPRPGQIVEATRAWEGPGASGAVCAVQLARLGADTSLYTTFGDDEAAAGARRLLAGSGVTVHAASHRGPQRRSTALLDASGERSIVVDSHDPSLRGVDPLPWRSLSEVDAVLFSGGDADALRHSRRAPIVVATARTHPTLTAAGVHVDALVGSSVDDDDRFDAARLPSAPALVAWTAAGEGGTLHAGGEDTAFAPMPLRAPVLDSYGCGASFAAGLTFALAGGADPLRAVERGARCGADCRTRHGPFAGCMEGR
jgi:ribokinase